MYLPLKSFKCVGLSWHFDHTELGQRKTSLKLRIAGPHLAPSPAPWDLDYRSRLVLKIDWHILQVLVSKLTSEFHVISQVDQDRSSRHKGLVPTGCGPSGRSKPHAFAIFCYGIGGLVKRWSRHEPTH